MCTNEVIYDWDGFSEYDFRELKEGLKGSGHTYGRVSVIVYDSQIGWKPELAKTVLLHITGCTEKGFCAITYREEMKSGCCGRFLGEYREVPVGEDYLAFRNTVFELTAGILDEEYEP
jgi:hypothetical protein